MSETPPDGLPDWVAHTPSSENPHWHWLKDHALDVTEMAKDFAKPFDGDILVGYLGQLHDLGKFTDDFQQYLLDCSRKIPRKPGSAPHKQHGALAVLDDLTPAFGEIAAVFAAIVHGHHGGIKTRAGAQEDIKKREVTSAEVSALRLRAAAIDPKLAGPLPAPETLIPERFATDQHSLEMFLRFVYSALVDADGLDTEKHKSPSKAQQRQASTLSRSDLRDRLIDRQTHDFGSADETQVNMVRREVYERCREAGRTLPPGVFSLTVPTGGGKTRSSLAFALEHAVARNLRRVIYAIPFTSIVDQTAQTFRDIFDDAPDAILEHHSAIEPRTTDGVDEEDRERDQESWRLLAAENWETEGIVVTTTVQLFESLFANRPGACRKLHQLAGSVIVLDEVQTLPVGLLDPLLSGLKTLAEKFGATIVLCTATQPALTLKSKFLDGFAQVIPIIAEPDVARHFSTLRRVRYRVDTAPQSWASIAAKMRAAESALCIVNTRRHALELLDELDPDGDDSTVFHLSTLLCGRDRRRILDEIRQRLKDKLPTVVASTQLVEAGVDVDFPMVLRALGPLDRIVQAAGRCNREGLRDPDNSHVLVFVPEKAGIPTGPYQMAASQTRQWIDDRIARNLPLDFDDPAAVTKWFAAYYASLRTGVDAKHVQLCRQDFNYPEVARLVRLIEDDTIPLLVTKVPGAENEAEAIVAKAQQIGAMTRDLWRRAQPLSVSVRQKDGEGCEKAVPGLRIWRGAYDKKRGLPLDIDPVDIYRPEDLVL